MYASHEGMSLVFSVYLGLEELDSDGRQGLGNSDASYAERDLCGTTIIFYRHLSIEYNMQLPIQLHNFNIHGITATDPSKNV